MRLPWSFLLPALLFALTAAAQAPITVDADQPLVLPQLISGPPPRLGTLAEAPDGGVDGVTRVVENVNFREAVERALARNPSTLTAIQEVARVQGLMQETLAQSIPTLTANLNYLKLDAARTFNGVVFSPGHQWAGNIQLAIPLLLPAAWANAIRAGDQVDVARLNSADVRRIIATNAAKAYIALIAQKRQVAVNVLARDTALVQLDYSNKRLSGGIGNKIDAARALQTAETAEVTLQASYANLYRAQEALGVLLGAPGPVDAGDPPTFPQLPGLDAALAEAPGQRTDLRLYREQEKAADKSLNMTWMEYLPTLTITGQPFWQDPSSVTAPSTGWQVLVQASWTIFDGMARYGRTHEREATLEESRITLAGGTRQVLSDVRQSFDTVNRSASALTSARKAATAAVDAYRLADIAYRAGATNNLDLIDAFRQARDAATQAIVAEDSLRQSALDLLVAAGRFPPER